MTSPAWIFFASLAGSLHCVGMCGGFACAIGGDARGPGASLARHLLYNLGRVGSYGFIGALAGQAGAFVVELCGDGWGLAAQRTLAVVSGALMVLIGLRFAGVLRHVAPRWPGALGDALAQALGPLLRAPGVAAPLALGTLNGWLPCPLVYAFAAQAAGSGGAASGVQVMLWFGLGTFPAMLLMGGLGLWWRRRQLNDGGVAGVATLRFTPSASGGPWARWQAWLRVDARAWGVRLAGGCIVLLGLVTAARGAWPMPAAMVGH
ncbi:MAG TPA: sulfite exporter TauE/SafE family protein [Ideonella sp.]|nr:sulfite exporter TauE/SafE family protein [Ideonella sp.]